MEGCTFEHNGPASFIKFKDYKGHTGGLSVSLFRHTSLHQTELNVTIRDTIFHNNSAMPEETAQRSPSQLFDQFIFTGRGGALGLFFGNNISRVNAEVTNCSFENNAALTFGGAAYVVFSSSSNHNVKYGIVALGVVLVQEHCLLDSLIQALVPSIAQYRSWIHSLQRIQLNKEVAVLFHHLDIKVWVGTCKDKFT